MAGWVPLLSTGRGVPGGLPWKQQVGMRHPAPPPPALAAAAGLLPSPDVPLSATSVIYSILTMGGPTQGLGRLHGGQEGSSAVLSGFVIGVSARRRHRCQAGPGCVAAPTPTISPLIPPKPTANIPRSFHGALRARLRRWGAGGAPAGRAATPPRQAGRCGSRCQVRPGHRKLGRTAAFAAWALPVLDVATWCLLALWSCSCSSALDCYH
jgi:hypothetical protein